MAGDPLELDRDTMRAMGYRVVDLLVERIATLAEGPVLRTGTRAEMAARLAEPPPAEGRDFEAVLDRLATDVLPYVGHFDHPRFFGYIPGAGTWPAALGDLIASATNIDSGAWREASGPSQLELTVLDWFREWIGYPPEAAGVLVSGGSAANLTAIACAREALVGPMSPDIVAYVSDQTHSSLARAARHLGFRPDQIRVMPTDSAYRMRVADLEAAMDADVAAGRLPFLVNANAGTTNTGAIDDLEAISHVCRARGAWMHVDGAYGAFAVLTERGRTALAGLELADSVTLDPHKWLAMPFEVGCLMVRDGAALERAFELHPEYLQERGGAGLHVVNFADRGLQLTRASRAIKVWLAIQTFGVDAFRDVIDRAIDLTLEAQRRIEADDRLELVTPASLGVVTFRRRGLAGESVAAVDRHNERIVASLAAAGDVLLTSTFIGGRYTIRLCVLNHTSDLDDVLYALERVAAAEVDAESGGNGHTPAMPGERAGIAVPERAARQAATLRVDARDGALSATDVRAVSALATVSDDQAEQLLAVAREEVVPAGRSVTERWARARTFYIVRTGFLDVHIEDRVVNRLGPGDAFGEVAAIDWGRDFSYGRTATVVAAEPSTLIAIPAAALRALMADSPEVDRAIRRLAQERLAVR
jgi:glutamate/tyrosine decarboxylase-like PLP-dependent enzyme